MLVAGVVLYMRATRPIDRIGMFALHGLILFLLVINVANMFGPPPPSVARGRMVGAGDLADRRVGLLDRQAPAAALKSMSIRDIEVTRRPSLKALACARYRLGAGAAVVPARQALTADERALAAFVDANNAEALALLERAVNINSGSMNFEGVRQVGALFRREFDALGLQDGVDRRRCVESRGPSRGHASGSGSEAAADRPPRHGVRARQSVSEVRAHRRGARQGPGHHGHEGRRRHSCCTRSRR